MPTELEREGKTQKSCRRQILPDCPQSLDPGFCPPVGGIKGRAGSGADSPAQRKEMGQVLEQESGEPQAVPYAALLCSYTALGFSMSSQPS